MDERNRAIEFYNLFYEKVKTGNQPIFRAKDCAIIAVDEVIKVTKQMWTNYGMSYMGSGDARINWTESDHYKYWEKVKSEIEKL